jgi:hypothetical protein
MEFGAGLALHEAWQLGTESTEDWDRLRGRLAEIRRRLSVLVSEIRALQNEPQAFSARFWRNFYRAMITHTLRSAMTKLLMALVLTLVGVHSRAEAQGHTTLVIAVDLSQSVAVRGPEGKSEFQKNIEAVAKQLAEVPSDSRVTVIGITDQSFTQPDILLSATIPGDAWYFGERLNAARNELVQVWKVRSSKLEPCYRRTDIVGALLLAAQMFDLETDQKVLVIYSDMRNNTLELNLQLSKDIPSFSRMNDSHKIPVANFSAVQVFVLGTAGAPTSSWEGLHQWWRNYFRASGAVLKLYSVLR